MGTEKSELRSWGGVWIILGPVMFLMADFSKIESDLTYYLQWFAFAGVAVAGVWCGWAALMGDARAVTGLFVLSYLLACSSSDWALWGSPSQVGRRCSAGLACRPLQRRGRSHSSTWRTH